METDAIKWLIECMKENWGDVWPDEIIAASDALAALESQVQSAADDATEREGRCMIAEAVDFKRWRQGVEDGSKEEETLRAVIEEVVRYHEDHGPNVLSARELDLLQLALASAPSDKVLVPLDKLREIETFPTADCDVCPACRADKPNRDDAGDWHVPDCWLAALIPVARREEE